MSKLLVTSYNIFGKLLRNNASTVASTVSGPKDKNEQRDFPCIILRPNKDDYTPIMRLMRTAYFADEPLSSFLGISHNAIIEESIIKALDEGLSVVAKLKESGEVVGACINETFYPWDPDVKTKLACGIQCPKAKKLIMFNAYLMKITNLWDIYNVPKVFELSYLFVNSNNRGKGIAGKLIEESKNIGLNMGYEIIRCTATSDFTSKICEKANMAKIDEVPYETYLGEDQKPIFEPKGPHKSVKIYIFINKKFKNAL